ncbi:MULTISPECIES: guanylate kinase [Prochlorococcus]|uniref:guanylate kinase n=1 Tax=Prochlorococcus TaxID=1218 RepID=UPI0005339576|nr:MULTISPECIES: guanylate kinase [Prochlorococcus]KGG12926.1 Guanylate kinase [Prochlorococcus sp. MIT 0601]
MTSTSSLTVITGPSGVGKGSLVKKLLERNNQIWLSISATTRLPREGETEGEHYFFLTIDKFKKEIENQGFLEWAEFSGNFYGTPRNQINKKISEGRKVLLEIELEGARQVRNNFPDSFQIFIAPPSVEELEKRIRGRGTETEKSIQSRLARAKEEIAAQKEFDAIVINDDLQEALIDIEKLIGLRS